MSSSSSLQQERQDDELSFVSKSILFFIEDILENRLGANEWNLWLVAIGSALLFAFIRLVCGKYMGIDWYALCHALVSAGGSCACSFLNAYATTSTPPEPLRSVLCYGPLTTLHTLVPAISLGYSLFDIADGLSLGFEFVAHGVALAIIMSIMIATDMPHLVTPMLMMEVSTIPLTTLKADFYGPNEAMMAQMMFAFLFFVFRCLLVPKIWFDLVFHLFHQAYYFPTTGEATTTTTTTTVPCYPPIFKYIVLIFGIFFHSLNYYWMYKIIRKARRKLKGQEKMKDAKMTD